MERTITVNRCKVNVRLAPAPYIDLSILSTASGKEPEKHIVSFQLSVAQLRELVQGLSEFSEDLGHNTEIGYQVRPENWEDRQRAKEEMR